LTEVAALQTDRLDLRELRAADIDDIARLYGDPMVTRYITGGVHTREMAQAWLDAQVAFWKRRRRFGMFRVADRATGAFLGRCGLRDLDDSGEMEIGYAFVPAAWGRGIATEAARATLDFSFQNSDLDHIAGITFPDNLASKKVLTNCGFRYLREDHFYGIDVSYFAISRKEWMTRADRASRSRDAAAGV
jgi:ribosomal-protein-alanine N-acetyltransferase